MTIGRRHNKFGFFLIAILVFFWMLTAIGCGKGKESDSKLIDDEAYDINWLVNLSTTT